MGWGQEGKIRGSRRDIEVNYRKKKIGERKSKKKIGGGGRGGVDRVLEEPNVEYLFIGRGYCQDASVFHTVAESYPVIPVVFCTEGLTFSMSTIPFTLENQRERESG